MPTVAPMPTQDPPIHSYFTGWDWAVVIGYLLLCTMVGHLLRGRQASIHDFFLGGRSLPWPAVTGSIIATEISGVTFIGVPAMVFAAGGNFTYLQWALGSIFARCLIGLYFVRYYYEKEIYSPYDFMGHRLGLGVKGLATVIFSIGSILGQSVRVLVAALALNVVTPWRFETCIVVIGLFAIVWTLIGGMRTVIWTDVMQFFLFAIGGFCALFWIAGSIDGGWTTIWNLSTAGDGLASLWTNVDAPEVNKFFLIDTRFEANLGFTLWVAIFAIPFLNLSAFGVDQLNAQRMFCCRSAADARKAIIASSAGQFLTLLMLLVGAALFVHYHINPPSPQAQALFDKTSDNVFPTWITTTLPTGLRGLVLGGVFAAAISSLDSILAALSQTTLSLFYHPERRSGDGDNPRRLLLLSRGLVLLWGIFLTGFAILLHSMRGAINVVELAFGMVAYTTGPMLGMLLAAFWVRRCSVAGLIAGFVLSFLLVLFIRTDLYTILIKADLLTVQQAAELGPFSISQDGSSLEPKIHFAWMYPITTLLTLACGAVAGWLRPREGT